MKQRKLTSDTTVWSYSIRSGKVKIHEIHLKAGRWVGERNFATAEEAEAAAADSVRSDKIVQASISRYAAEAAADYSAAKRRALHSGPLEDFLDGSAN